MAVGFIGNVLVEWLSNDGADRDMKLLQEFAFEDENGHVWEVPAAAVINGASIPQVFWNTFGPPFVGDYRRASVVHDYHCVVRTYSSSAVHRMFHSACRAGGVSRIKAKSMYLAVRAFGPSWDVLARPLSVPGVPEIAAGRAVELARQMDVAVFEALQKQIEEEDLSLDEIDAKIDENSVLMPAIPGFSITE